MSNSRIKRRLENNDREERKVEARYEDTTQWSETPLQIVSMNSTRVLNHIKMKVRHASHLINALETLSNKGIPISVEMINAAILAGGSVGFFCQEIEKMHKEGIEFSQAIFDSLSVTDKSDASDMIIDLHKHEVPLHDLIIRSGHQAIRSKLVGEHFIVFLMLFYTYFDYRSVQIIASMFNESARTDVVEQTEKYIEENQAEAKHIDELELVTSDSLPLPLEIKKLVRSFFPVNNAMTPEQAQDIADFKLTLLGR